MATAAPTSGADSGAFLIIQPGQRLFTAADLAAMPTHLPSGDVSFELHHGRLVAMSPPGATHGSLQLRIGAALLFQGEIKGHGKAYTEVAIVLDRKPDHVVGADAAFIAKQSLPARESPEGYLETIPELVVEVRSKNDTAAEIATKIADYLKAGCVIAWVIEPDTKTVIEHRANAQPKTYRIADALSCDDVIPGFRLLLADLFQN
jgi:Uma2 family endonuclease